MILGAADRGRSNDHAALSMEPSSGVEGLLSSMLLSPSLLRAAIWCSCLLLHEFNLASAVSISSIVVLAVWWPSGPLDLSCRIPSGVIAPGLGFGCGIGLRSSSELMLKSCSSPLSAGHDTATVLLLLPCIFVQDHCRDELGYGGAFLHWHHHESILNII